MIFEEHKGCYSYCRICLELRNRGYHINHKRIPRLLCSLGLKAIICRKRHFSSLLEVKFGKVDNLIQRDFRANKPYQKVYTDVIKFR